MNEEKESSSLVEFFGFDGKPEPGIDYGWIKIQNYLSFIGNNIYLNNCQLYSSAQKTLLFMIRTQDEEEFIWDASYSHFSVLSPDLSVLVAEFNGQYIHISNVSESLLELIMNAQKLPLNLLDNNIPMQLNYYKIKKIEKIENIPTSETQNLVE